MDRAQGEVIKHKYSAIGFSALIFIAIAALLIAAGQEWRPVGRDIHAAGIFLPGTQPLELADIDSVNRCRQCHAQRGDTAPVKTWGGSMMSQAMRDPLLFAALAVANQDIKGSGDFCLRCHTPQGWLLGRSEPPDGSALSVEDHDGVTCDACHLMIDPLSGEGKARVQDSLVPDYSNGMYVIETRAIKRGPRSDAVSPHEVKFAPWFSRGEFCGTCHDVTNPINNLPIERTYSEWKQSWYADQGTAGSCQACHMKPAAGYAAEPDLAASELPYRPDVAVHDLTGGSNWIYDALPLLWPNLNTAALQAGKKRALNTLEQAADIRLIPAKGNPASLTVRITNKTGHKLPTGYPEGRRMWINVKGLDDKGALTFESGKYDPKQAELLEDEQIKIYQAKQGIKGKGPTFHFVLNDYMAKDNRIPPKGFTNKAFEKAGTPVVGYRYADGQYWDDTKYTLPLGTKKVVVSLLYQTSEKAYIDFLAKENKTDDWGKKLLRVWKATGKSAPIPISTAEMTIE